MTDRPLWHEAAAFSARVHRHQLRKDGATPYAAHPARVALALATVFGVEDDEVLAAGFLHDAIEDCAVDYDEVRLHFGDRIAGLVVAMTKDMRLPEPEREAAYDRQLADGPWEGRLIKLADVWDNLQDVRSSRARTRLLDRARRAIALAEGDERLARARGIVAELADCIRRRAEAEEPAAASGRPSG